VKTRDRIIQASIELFNEHGERQITTNHIAAHMGISPGNLYYHFRNKNDIIHHIFEAFKQQLDGCIFPVEQRTNNIEFLRQTFDAVFELMWRFNFFYSNLPDILSRDDKLRQDYIDVQVRQAQQLVDVVSALKRAGVLNIPTEDIADFVNAIKVTVTFWISYLKTQPMITQCDELVVKVNRPTMTGKLEKPMIYKGVLTVLLLLKPYLSAEDQAGFKALQQHYGQLAGSGNEQTLQSSFR
jgi:AcrR family transcriptional regulator